MRKITGRKENLIELFDVIFVTNKIPPYKLKFNENSIIRRYCKISIFFANFKKFQLLFAFFVLLLQLMQKFIPLTLQQFQRQMQKAETMKC